MGAATNDDGVGIFFEVYQKQQHIEALDIAIQFARRSAAATEASDELYLKRLDNLGTVLWSRSGRAKKVHDLEQWVLLAKKIVDIAPRDHPRRPIMLIDLANRLKV